MGNILAFVAVATLLTVTPGLDTALILRTSISESPRRAFAAGLGIVAGCFAWGLLVAIGLGALLKASTLAYDLMRGVGAIYLFYLGGKLVLSPRSDFDLQRREEPTTKQTRWFVQGFLTNILNPKVGLFYVSFIPQFIPAGSNVPLMAALLAAIHASIGIVWFGLLIGATRPISSLLKRPPVIAWLDRVTAGVFVAFGAKLALSRA